MVDLFEHVLLFAICILIMRLSLTLPTWNPEGILPTGSVVPPTVDAYIMVAVSAAMAVPLWVALEVIWCGMNALLNLPIT